MLVISHSEYYIVAFRAAEKVLLLHEILLQARAVHFQMNRTNTATEEKGIRFFF